MFRDVSLTVSGNYAIFTTVVRWKLFDLDRELGEDEV